MQSPRLLAALLLLTVLPAQIYCQVTIGLTQTDYTSSDGGQTIPIEVTRRGSHSSGILLQVLPLTLLDYTAQFPELPCGTRENLLGNDDDAERTDFNSTVMETTIPPNPTGATDTFSFTLNLVPDTAVESNEVFVVILDLPNTNNTVVVERRCAVVRLEGTRQGEEFLQIITGLLAGDDNIAIREGDGKLVLFNITKIVESELIIEVNIQVLNSNSLTTDSDFTLSESQFHILPSQSGSLVNITVEDDTLAEDTESFTFIITARTVKFILTQSFSLRLEILDNEVVNVGFETDLAVRSIFEGESFELCATLRNFTKENYFRLFPFSISSTNGTGKAGEDYTNILVLFQPLILEPACFFVSSIENNITNGRRYFTVAFDKTLLDELDDGLTIVSPNSLRVEIIDDDAKPLAPETIGLDVVDKTLVVSWRGEVTPERPITGFYGSIRELGEPPRPEGDGFFAEFTSDQDTTSYEFREVEQDTEYRIVICSENVNGRNCTAINHKLDTTEPITPLVLKPITPLVTEPITPLVLELTQRPRLPPGLVLGVGVGVASAVLCCCILLLLILLCACCKRDRERSYLPAKSKKRELKGRSALDQPEWGSPPPDISLSFEDSNEPTFKY